MKLAENFSNDVYIWGFAAKYVLFPNRVKSLLRTFPNIKRKKMPPVVEQLCNSIDVGSYKDVADIWQTITYCLENDRQGLEDYFKLHFEKIYRDISDAIPPRFNTCSDEEYINAFVYTLLLAAMMEGKSEDDKFYFDDANAQIEVYLKICIRSLKGSKCQVKFKDDVSAFMNEALTDCRYWGDVFEVSLLEGDKWILEQEVEDSKLTVDINNFDYYKKCFLGAGLSYSLACRIFAMEGLNLDEILSKTTKKKDETYNAIGTCQALCALRDVYRPDPDYYGFTDVLLSLAKAYKAAGRTYRNEASKKIVEQKNSSDVANLEAQLAASKEENKKLREKLETLEKEQDKVVVKATKPLEKEVKALKDDNARLIAMKRELDALREFAFKVDSGAEEVPEEVSLADAVKDKKIAIIGGPEPFLVKMRSLYPDFTILSGTLLTMNTDILPQFDHIFLYTSHMSHSLYYKVMNVCRARGLEYSYLGYHQNPKFIENEMVEALKD